MKKKSLFFIAILICSQSIFQCKDIVEEQCEQACEQFVTCVEKARNIQLSPNDRVSGRIQCVQGCTMIQGDILRCYQEEPNSCEGFQECIIQSGALE
jgi:Cys-rich protein (TIGR04453 family)